MQYENLDRWNVQEAYSYTLTARPEGKPSNLIFLSGNPLRKMEVRRVVRPNFLTVLRSRKWKYSCVVMRQFQDFIYSGWRREGSGSQLFLLERLRSETRQLLRMSQ